MRRTVIAAVAFAMTLAIAGVVNATLTSDLVTIWTTRYTSATTAATAVATAIESHVTGATVAEALALAANGSNCTGSNFALGVDEAGIAECAQPDHGGATGLTDDDHTQYALLAGRSGGQSLDGGTAAGDDLTLISTDNATKGSVFIGGSGEVEWDDANNLLGIGVAPSTYRVRVQAADDPLLAEESDAGTASIESPVAVKHTSSGTMTDGFGVGVSFLLRDDSAADNLVAQIQAVRSGADDSAELRLRTSNVGSIGTRLTIGPEGDVTLARGVNHVVLASDVTCAVSASYCTIFSITPGASRGVLIKAYIVIDADSTTVAPQFRVSSADTGYTGRCRWQLDSAATGTTTAPVVDNVAIGTAPADTADTAWPDTAPGIAEVTCSLVSDASPGAILIEWQLETGTTPTQTVKAGSWYSLATF